MVTSTGSTQRPVAPLYDRLTHMVMHLQFVWWLGHVTTFIFSTLYYLFYYANYSGVSFWAYYTALAGAVIAYPIALYKSLGSSMANLTDVQSVIKNDNTQYLLLTFLWLSQYPTVVALGPLAIFSGLHTVIYLTKTVVPTLLPPGSATPSSTTTPSSTSPNYGTTDSTKSLAIRISENINRFACNNYSNAMVVVAAWEIVLTPIWVLLQTMLFQLSFFTPVLYGAFILGRYYVSPGHQQLFQNVKETMDHLVVENPKVNPNVRDAYIGTRDRVASMVHSPTDKAKKTA